MKILWTRMEEVKKELHHVEIILVGNVKVKHQINNIYLQT